MGCESSAQTRVHFPEHPPRSKSQTLFPPPFAFSSLLGPQPTANSNHSRTSAAFARKSNHSRTYAKTGGWGSYRYGNVSQICRRADILGCRGLFSQSLEGPPRLAVTQR